MPEVEFYIKTKDHVSQADKYSRYGLRIADEERTEAIKHFNKCLEWIRVAKRNSVATASKTIGTLEGGIGRRIFMFEVSTKNDSVNYSLGIYTGGYNSIGTPERMPLDENDINAMLLLLGQASKLDSLLKKEVSSWDKNKDKLFK